MIYAENQIQRVFPWIHKAPKWFILGGPADANEAQCIRERYPTIKVIAFEPLMQNVEWQRSNGFPADGVLLPYALGDTAGTAMLSIDPDERNGHRCASIASDHSRAFGQVEVKVTTLDEADRTYGPFEEAFLWLDIEGSELSAIRGASTLLKEGRVNWVNIEANSRTSGITTKIHRVLRSYGFGVVSDWNVRQVNSHQIKDVFYRKIR